MEKTIIHNYKRIYVVDLTVYGNGACDRSSMWEWSGRDVKNKMACYYSDSSNDFLSELSFETKGVSVTPKSRLFVSSECKVSRDTYRNSGYSISRDKANANIIIVPDIIRRLYVWKNCNMVAVNEDEEKLYLVNIEKYGCGTGLELGDNEFLIAKNFLESSMKLTVDKTDIPNLWVWFLPKCETLVELMTGNALSVPYVQESKIPITASTKISPETLVLWENIEDENLLVRTICTSDWRDYPITVLTLLAGFRKDTNWFNPATGDFRRILQAIGYNYTTWYYNDEDRALGFLQGKKISPKDYEMLQNYIYCRLGVDQNGGFISPAQYASLPICIQRIMNRRIAVKPFNLPERMNCVDLMTVLRK